jgi:mycothiol synthase
MSSSPPDGFSVRPATVDDAPAINELVNAADTAVQGWSESSEGELLGWWRMIDLEHNSWVLLEGEEVAAYAVGFAHADMLELDGFVHPEQRGRGLGAWLVARAEGRARELGKQRLLAFSLAGDNRAHRLFEQFGMRDLRRYYRMMIDLESEPAPPRWAAGLHVGTFEPEDAKAFHDALREAFEDEWNFVRMPFEEWREMRLVKDPDFDPTLWFIVRDGDEIAAVMRNEPDRSGAGLRRRAGRAQAVAEARHRPCPAAACVRRVLPTRQAPGRPWGRRREPDRRHAAVRARRDAHRLRGRDVR